MKKNYLLLSALLAAMSVTAATAEPPHNALGIRASYQPSYVTSHGISTSIHNGYSVGLYDQIRLSGKIPFYVETGIEFSSKGYKIKGFENSSTTINYMEIPVGILYRIPVGRDVSIQPRVGVYYAYGIWGRLHYGTDQSINVFKQQCLSRHDFGYNVGAAVTYRNVYFGISFESGLLDIDKYDPIYTDQAGMLGYSKLKNASISITLGYNFNF